MKPQFSILTVRFLSLYFIVVFFFLVWWISEVSGQKNRCTCKHCCKLCSFCILNWYLAQNKLKTAERERVMLTKSHIKYITTDEKNAFPSSKLRAAKLEATSWSGYFTAIYWKKNPKHHFLVENPPLCQKCNTGLPFQVRLPGLTKRK